ncbi:hypothetical protein LJR219_003039 [Phenylobacterium sp. LjRoot219]|uniref:hypothetical protein n=1 Tax=Phenylobacterium sp. LjRoot219 TaxID=3342283 RepID=UPI003ECF3933
MSHAASTDQNDAVETAWRRNLQAGEVAARAFHAETADFAGRLLDLNLEAARSFGRPATNDPMAAPFAFSASALELYLGYLGRSTALAQKAIVLPWTHPRARV